MSYKNQINNETPQQKLNYYTKFDSYRLVFSRKAHKTYICNISSTGLPANPDAPGCNYELLRMSLEPHMNEINPTECMKRTLNEDENLVIRTE
jgi:hypothetical protein